MHDSDFPSIDSMIDSLPASAVVKPTREELHRRLGVLDSIFYFSADGELLTDGAKLAQVLESVADAQGTEAFIERLNSASSGHVYRDGKLPPGHRPASWTEGVRSAVAYQPVDLGLSPSDSAAEIESKLKAALPGLSPDVFAAKFAYDVTTRLLGQLRSGPKQSRRKVGHILTSDYYNCLLRNLGWPTVLLLIGVFGLLIVLSAPTGETVLGWWLVVFICCGGGALGIFNALYNCANNPNW